MKGSVLLLMFVYKSSFGFLLDSGNSTIQGQNIYLTVSQYYDDKNRMKQEQERTLDVLAKQIQSKFDAFEQKLLEKTPTNQNERIIIEMEAKYQEMELKYEEMKNSSETWHGLFIGLEQKFSELQKSCNNSTAEIRTEIKHVITDSIHLKNDTLALQEKILHIEQLKDINQLQTLSKIEQTTNNLETTVQSMKNTELARTQDFIGLYNMVKSLETEGENIKTSLQNNASFIKSIENKTEEEFQEIWTIQNASMSLLQRQLDQKLRPVELTACRALTGIEDIAPGVIKFPVIKSSAGITQMNTFVSSGKVIIEDPGYYFVSTTICSKNVHAEVRIMVNNSEKHRQRITGVTSGSHPPGTVQMALRLEKNDQVWIGSLGNYNIYQSCLTIYKFN